MIQVPAVIARVSTMADGTIRITLDLPELESNTMAGIFDLRGKNVLASLSEEK